MIDMHPAEQYAREVVAGLRGPCNIWEIKACQRHLNDLTRQGTETFPYVFDETRAQRIYDWFEKCCRHPRGVFSGQLIKMNPAQKFDNGVLFGWVHKDTGRRRFKVALNLRAKGNYKSVEASCKANYFMCADCVYPPGHPELRQYELSPEVDCVAVDRQQAKIVWDDSVTIGQASPEISKRLKFYTGHVKHKTRGGKMRPLSKDSKNKQGAAPCYYEVDEYGSQPTSIMFDTGRSSLGKRAQALLEVNSTAGDDAENNPCKKEYDIGCMILDGKIIQEDYFVMIRQLDKDDSPHDFSKLVKANPILQEPTEYSEILLEEIKSEHDLAYGSGDPAKIRNYLTYRCNMWQMGSSDKFMDGLMDKWKALEVSREEFEKLTKGLKCLVGDDLSKRIDITGHVYTFKLPDGRYAMKAHGFIPEDSVTAHEHSDRIPYRYYAEQGYCTIIPGAVIDSDYLIEHAHQMEFDQKIQIIEWDYDPALASGLGKDIEREKYKGQEINQKTIYVSEATKNFREYVLKGILIHEKNELFDKHLGNAYQYNGPNETIKAVKRTKDDPNRIDLLAAAINTMVRISALDTKPHDAGEYIKDDILNKMWG